MLSAFDLDSEVIYNSWGSLRILIIFFLINMHGKQIK